MKDDLGQRMKENYEQRTKYKLPRRTYTIIRIDGKAFHTYTKGLNTPFDADLIQDMNAVAQFLCQNIQGAKFAYVQSDEISILLTDFDNLNTDAWFDNNIQKMTSVSASLATGKFNNLRAIRNITTDYLDNAFENIETQQLAFFDSRVFTIPYHQEVANYFIWRQQDAVRNSIQSLAQSLYSHNQLKNMNTSQLQDMCMGKGHSWNDLNPAYKRGRMVVKKAIKSKLTDLLGMSMWVIETPPTFTINREYLMNLIPIDNN